MKTKHLVPVSDFCTHHEIEISFINSLQNNGLISIECIDNSKFIHADQVLKLEQYVHFYYDLDINIEGIETVTHLLNQIELLQQRIQLLHNQLLLHDIN
jgi:hypothetical protein